MGSIMAEGEKTIWADGEKPGQKGKIKIEAGYEKARAHVLITGMVRGVFFRSTLRSQAKLLEINGWTRNTIDDNVEAVFEGEKDRVEKIVSFCWKGPPGAFVRDVKVEWQKPKYEAKGFEIRY